jgi:cohesin loading factor subunit SCC2
LYFADNIAYFAYQTQDEPLFVMHQIDPIMAMICPDALHRFRKAFRLAVPQENCPDEDVYDEEELETPENLRRSLTGDLAELRRCYRLCQPSFLLIGLKKFLADYYGFGAAKLKEYSPNEKQAVWEKPIVSRKQAFKFAPGIVVEFVSKELKGTLEEFLTADLLVKKFLDVSMGALTDASTKFDQCADYFHL